MQARAHAPASDMRVDMNATISAGLAQEAREETEVGELDRTAIVEDEGAEGGADAA